MSELLKQAGIVCKVGPQELIGKRFKLETGGRGGLVPSAGPSWSKVIYASIDGVSANSYSGEPVLVFTASGDLFLKGERNILFSTSVKEFGATLFAEGDLMWGLTFTILD